MKRFLPILVILVLAVSTQAQVSDMLTSIVKQAYQEEIRQIVAENIKIPQGKEQAFTLIYNEFEAANKEVIAEGTAIIGLYVTNYYTMTDLQADELAMRKFSNDAAFAKLEKKTYKKLSKEVAPATAILFVQLMNRIKIASALSIMIQVPVLGMEE